MNHVLTIIIISVFCGGCIALPIPREEAITPKISGKIIFSPKPVKAPLIHYELRIEKDIYTGNIIPDKEGKYHIPERKEIFYWYFIPLCAMDLAPLKGSINIKINKQQAYHKEVSLYNGLNHHDFNEIKLGLLKVKLKQKTKPHSQN
jgi:hypothetical protein